MIVTYNKKYANEAFDFLHIIGTKASKSFVFNNTDFPTLGNSKDLGRGSHSYLSALKKSLINEPPYASPTPRNTTPSRTQLNKHSQSRTPTQSSNPAPQTVTSQSTPKEISNLNQRIETLER